MSTGNPCWLAKDINAVRAKIRPNKTDAGSFTVVLSLNTLFTIVMYNKAHILEFTI